MGQTLRVATFNLESLDDRPGNKPDIEERLSILRPQLVRLRADVLCLQEVNAQSGDDKARNLLALDRLVADTPYEDFSRFASVYQSTGQPRDRHNLVILSRLPLIETRQIRHALVETPFYKAATADPPMADPEGIEWDRPLLYAAVGLDNGRTLHVVNVHLRAPRAAFVPGQKADSTTWSSMRGWAEGFFLAAVKQAGQALEARFLVEDLLDEDEDALILVCGDFNAADREPAVRTIRGDDEDAGNPHLATRTLINLERSLPQSQRFSVIHHGRPQMLDHVLVSRPLLAWYRTAEIHNEALGDELITPAAVRGSPESFHAPLVVEFIFAD